MKIIQLTILCVAVSTAATLEAKERSTDDFKAYAAKRLSKVDEGQLETYVSKVDKNSDGSVSEEEFQSRIKIYLEVFKRAEIKAQKLGHGLPENWFTDWEKAKQESSQTGKPILAMFSASWCGPCKTMISNVFPTDDVQGALESFVAVYIDSEKHRELASENGIRAFPTFKCFTTEDLEVAEHVGAKPTEGFLELLDQFQGKVLEKQREVSEANSNSAAESKTSK